MTLRTGHDSHRRHMPQHGAPAENSNACVYMAFQRTWCHLVGILGSLPWKVVTEFMYVKCCQNIMHLVLTLSAPCLVRTLSL